MQIVAGAGLGIAVLLPVLTAVGAQRRGRGPAGALLAGIIFPITWAVWYLRDEHPYRRELHRLGSAK